MWTQVVGKVALALAPPLNHSWSVAFQVTPRGLATRTLPHGDRTFTMEFDFVDHELHIRASDGAVRTLALRPRTVADFYREVMATLTGMGLPVKVWPVPAEIPSPIRFEEDTVHQSYDPVWVDRWWRVVSQVARIFTVSICGFVGKSARCISSGKLRSGGAVLGKAGAAPRTGVHARRAARSISVGFWPGGDRCPSRVLCVCCPAPAGLSKPACSRTRPTITRVSAVLLPYDAVRTAAAPEERCGRLSTARRRRRCRSSRRGGCSSGRV
jgi:hypothetical protein